MSGGDCLLTGASGFLGRHVARGLKIDGQRVVALSRTSASDPSHIRADLAGDDDIDFRGRSFEIVYHLAGLAHTVPLSSEEKERFFRVNHAGTLNLLRALERASRLPVAVVLASTVAVYGMETGRLLDEETPRAARDPYGASKRMAEDALVEWGEKRGVRVGIVRLPLVAGRGAPGNLGAMVRALRRGRYLGVGTGAARRSMVWAEDLVHVLPKIAHTGGVFHLTDDHHPSFSELEKALSIALRRAAPPHLPLWMARSAARLGDLAQGVTGIKMPLTARGLSKMILDLTFTDEKARRVLGWQPTRVIDRAAELVM